MLFNFAAFTHNERGGLVKMPWWPNLNIPLLFNVIVTC